MSTVTVNARGFDRAIRYAEKAAARDDSRPTLSHLALEVKKGSLAVVGCDTFRLHRGTVVVQDGVNGQWLVHRKDAMVGIRQYKKDARPRKNEIVELTLGEKGLLVASNCRTVVEFPTDNWGNPNTRSEWDRISRRYVTVKVTDEPTRPNYPDWKQVWPQDGVTVEVGKKELVGVLKKAIAMAKEVGKVHRYAYYANPYAVLKVASGRLCVRLLRDGVACEIVGDIPSVGKAVRFGINGRYLLDAIYGITGDAVTIRVQDDPGHPLVVGEVAVVMPVHLGGRTRQ